MLERDKLSTLKSQQRGTLAGSSHHDRVFFLASAAEVLGSSCSDLDLLLTFQHVGMTCRTELPSKHTSLMEESLGGDALRRRHRKWPSAKPHHVKVVHEPRSNLRSRSRTCPKRCATRGAEPHGLREPRRAEPPADKRGIWWRYSTPHSVILGIVRSSNSSRCLLPSPRSECGKVKYGGILSLFARSDLSGRLAVVQACSLGSHSHSL